MSSFAEKRKYSTYGKSSSQSAPHISFLPPLNWDENDEPFSQDSVAKKKRSRPIKNENDKPTKANRVKNESERRNKVTKAKVTKNDEDAGMESDDSLQPRHKRKALATIPSENVVSSYQRSSKASKPEPKKRSSSSIKPSSPGDDEKNESEKKDSSQSDQVRSDDDDNIISKPKIAYKKRYTPRHSNSPDINEPTEEDEKHVVSAIRSNRSKASTGMAFVPIEVAGLVKGKARMKTLASRGMASSSEDSAESK